MLSKPSFLFHSMVQFMLVFWEDGKRTAIWGSFALKVWQFSELAHLAPGRLSRLTRPNFVWHRGEYRWALAPNICIFSKHTIVVCISCSLTVSWKICGQSTPEWSLYFWAYQCTKKGSWPLKGSVSAQKAPSRVRDRDNGVAAEKNDRDHWYAIQANLLFSLPI